MLTNARGFALFEVLVAMVLFAIGVLGMVGMQSLAIRATADSRERIEAVYYVNQLLGQMWADDRTNLARYAHRAAGGAPPQCQYTGTPSTYAPVTNWFSALRDAHHGLPGVVDDASTQIVVIPDSPVAGTTSVQISLCWKRPDDALWHRHTAIANISDS